MRVSGSLLGRAGGPHGGEREDHREERDGVQEIDERQARGRHGPVVGEPAGRQRSRVSGQDESRNRGSADHRRLESREIQGQRAGELLRRHEPGKQRVARRIVERSRRGRQDIQAVERPERLTVREGQARQGQRHGGHRELGRDHDPAAVVAVGDDAGPEREGDDGHDARQPHESERQRRARQQVDVPVQGHRLHLRSDERKELRPDEPPVVAVPQGAVGAVG